MRRQSQGLNLYAETNLILQYKRWYIIYTDKFCWILLHTIAHNKGNYRKQRFREIDLKSKTRSLEGVQKTEKGDVIIQNHK